jgi:hypothetical protein
MSFPGARTSDVQLRIGESMIPIVRMDSGLSPAGCPGMTRSGPVARSTFQTAARALLASTRLVVDPTCWCDFAVCTSISQHKPLVTRGSTVGALTQKWDRPEYVPNRGRSLASVSSRLIGIDRSQMAFRSSDWRSDLLRPGCDVAADFNIHSSSSLVGGAL